MAIRLLDCPCGERLIGDDEGDLVAVARRHLQAEHPSLVDVYGDEDILVLSRPIRTRPDVDDKRA